MKKEKEQNCPMLGLSPEQMKSAVNSGKKDSKSARKNLQDFFAESNASMMGGWT